jgi:hypothetical protein
LRSEQLSCKGRRFAGLFVGYRRELLPAAATSLFDWFFLRPPVPTLPESTARSNKPLMACTEHWKSIPVLPMFRAYPLASDLRFPARRALNTRGSARPEMPWMKS